MIQEYLLLDEAEKEKISKYRPEAVDINFISLKGSGYYIRYSVSGENEKLAKTLSKLHEYITQNFKVTILTSDSSWYFSKRLYPLISRFELLLRKLLYFACVSSEDDEQSKHIVNLDTQTLGQLFTTLFIDSDYMQKTKEAVKNKNLDKFSKSELIALVSSVKEESLWDKLLGKDVVPTLRDNFLRVKSLRDSVMHSHYLNWTQYQSASKLYKTINNELEEAIEEYSKKNTSVEGVKSFSQRFADEIKIREQILRIREVLTQPEWIAIFQKTLNDYYVSSRIETIKEALTSIPSINYELPPEYKKLQEILGTIRFQPSIIDQLASTIPSVDELKNDEDDIVENENGESTNGQDENGIPESDSGKH